MREHTTLKMELESAQINTGFTKDLGRAGQRKPLSDVLKLYTDYYNTTTSKANKKVMRCGGIPKTDRGLF